MWYKFLNWFYDLIRPFVVLGKIDPNEDFKCMECGKPVLRRVLYCSQVCNIQQDLNITMENVLYLKSKLEGRVFNSKEKLRGFEQVPPL